MLTSNRVGFFRGCLNLWLKAATAPGKTICLISIGSLVSPLDPIAENGGINLYAYVGNDPVNYWDFLGANQNMQERLVANIKSLPLVESHTSPPTVAS